MQADRYCIPRRASGVVDNAGRVLDSACSAKAVRQQRVEKYSWGGAMSSQDAVLIGYSCSCYAD